MGKPRFSIRETNRLVFQTFVDCNMAEAWVGDQLRIFPGKTGEDPVWGDARDLRHASGRTVGEAMTQPEQAFTSAILPPNAPPGEPGLHGAFWFESLYQTAAGTLYALYHNENYPATLPWDEATGTGYRTQDWPHGLRGESSVQAVCRIGIMRSDDGGLSWTDRGILLEDLDDRLIRAPINRNWTFPGGVGDPSAVACGDHLYVFFGEYGYPGPYDPATHSPDVESAGQCISVARVALADLDAPQERAFRWGGSAFDAPWNGVGQPIAALRIPAADGGGPVSSGQHSFHWGPSVSWNEAIRCWVMVMGRVDSEFWAGDSIWISFNPHADLGVGANCQDWSAPRLLLRKPGHTLWYPSLQPPDDPDSVAARHTCVRMGKRARLWVKDLAPSVHRYVSEYELTFHLEE